MTDVDDLHDPADDIPAKEEPDCTTCCDQGFVDDLTGETGTANCPDCNPSVPCKPGKCTWFGQSCGYGTCWQLALEHERRLASCGIDPAAEPF